MPTDVHVTVDPMTSATFSALRAPQPTGLAAKVADARAQLRSAAPAGAWDGVLAEVQRLQQDQSMPMLAALQAVYAKLAAGWTPRS